MPSDQPKRKLARVHPLINQRASAAAAVTHPMDLPGREVAVVGSAAAQFARSQAQSSPEATVDKEGHSVTPTYADLQTSVATTSWLRLTVWPGEFVVERVRFDQTRRPIWPPRGKMLRSCPGRTGILWKGGRRTFGVQRAQPRGIIGCLRQVSVRPHAAPRGSSMVLATGAS